MDRKENFNKLGLIEISTKQEKTDSVPQQVEELEIQSINDENLAPDENSESYLEEL